MSPTSYQTAPSRDIKLSGGGKGIRTPAPIARPPGFQDRSLQPDLGIPPHFPGQQSNYSKDILACQPHFFIFLYFLILI